MHHLLLGQQKSNFEVMQRHSYISSLNDITNETTLIISNAKRALLAVFDNENGASSSKANIALQYLSCVGNQNNIYQRLSEEAYKKSNLEDEDIRAFECVVDDHYRIAEFEVSTGHVTDAEYWERIEKSFKKVRDGNGEETKSHYIPQNILG